MTTQLKGPLVVLSFASISDPAVSLADQSLRQTIAGAVAPFGLGAVNNFSGISDMSFSGEALGDLSVVAASIAIWGKSFTMPKPCNVPTITIGPWGVTITPGWRDCMHPMPSKRCPVFCRR